ncbi:MAG: small multi-drug export protein [Candidatus Aureabacteria bacterium]|nr:small multi-drug export protein [Candidatus Auribacterota bacterium]
MKNNDPSIQTLLKSGKKYAFLLQSPEGKLFVVAAVGFITVLIANLFLFFFSPSLAGILLIAFFVNFFGSRLASILVCLEGGLSPLFIIGYHAVLESIGVGLVFPLFVFFLRKEIEIKWLNTSMQKIQNAVHKYGFWLKKGRGLGLFLFVLLPVQVAGPVSGAIVGYFLRYKLQENLSIILSSTFTSVMLYVWGGKEVIIRLKAWSSQASLIILIVILVLIGLHLSSLLKWIRSK